MAAPHTLKRFVESFPGSSFPTLSETEAGGTWVVKMRGAGNGADCLVSEYLVNRIAHQAGLPVPDACIIEIPGGHPWTFGTDEFDDIVQKSTGPNLGLTLIPDARRTVPEGYDSLAADMISQMVTLDLAFSNQDRSRASGNLLRDAAGLDWIVDHGGCRFLFQPQPGRAAGLPEGHVFAGKEALLDECWLAGVTKHQVITIVDELPNLWLQESRLTREEVFKRTWEVVGQQLK